MPSSHWETDASDAFVTSDGDARAAAETATGDETAEEAASPIEGSGPGVGLAVALVALFGAALLASRR